MKTAKKAFAYNPKSFDGLIWREVYKWSWATVSCGIGQEDLVQAGYMGLARAAQKFEPERGVQFSTYAMWWVRAMIKTEALNMARTVRVPDKESLRAARAGTPHPTLAVSLDATEYAAFSDEKAPAPDEDDPEEERDRMASAMDQLPERLRRVLRMRFFSDLKLHEIGAELGVTRERARQLEAQALDKLKVALAT